MKDFDKAYDEILTEQSEVIKEQQDNELFFEELFELFESNSETVTEDEFFEEVADIVMEDDDEVLSEREMSITQRKKISRRMKRIAKMPKVQKARERNFKKGKSYAEWQKRGKKAFRRFFKKRLLLKKRGKTLETATARDKSAIEKIISSPKFLKKFKSKMRKFTIALMKKEKAKKANKHMDKAEKRANELLPKPGKL
jgi:hypothetical protein